MSKDLMIESLSAFCDCFPQHSLLPEKQGNGGLQTAVARASSFRARTSKLYLAVARCCSEQMDVEFRLKRALHEGNISNLLAFAQPLANSQNMPADLPSRLSRMQDEMQHLLPHLESKFDQQVPCSLQELCADMMEIFFVMREDLIVEIVDRIVPLTPYTVEEFKKYARTQLTAISEYVLKKSRDPRLQSRARELQEGGHKWS